MQECKEFYRKVLGDEAITPYEHQVNGWKGIKKNNNVIFDVGTGGGKTEAALFPALAEGKRVILVYPTKALIEDQKERLKNKYDFEAIRENTEFEFAVDTGESKDTTLYRADIILTTLDKLLYRVFGYGNERWAYIYPWRLLASDNNLLKESVLIFDEAHIYDEIALGHLVFLINRLTYENNIQTVILSATLPEDIKEYLLDKDCSKFPRPEKDFFVSITDREKEIKRGKQKYVNHIAEEEVVKKAVEEYRKNKKVAVIVNWVYRTEKRPSIEDIWKKIVEKLTEDEKKDVIIYHGYQFPEQRQKYLNLLTDNPDKCILISSSALEVGVDISSDVMITEICTPDAFIQRIGRCARMEGIGDIYTFAEPNDIVDPQVGQKQDKLKDFLKDYREKILNNKIKEDINKLNILEIDPAKLRSNLSYQLDEKLYKYVYDFNLPSEDIWQKGMVITRSWKPSIYIQYSENDENRLRIPINYSLRKKYREDWWLETRNEYGKRKIIRREDLNSLSWDDIYFDKIDGKMIFDARRVDLILKTSRIDQKFGLLGRENLKPQVEKHRRFPLEKYIFEPVSGIGLFWWQPEGVNIYG